MQANQIKNCSVDVQTVTEPPYHHFFGYYDKTPWSPSGQCLLAHRTTCTAHIPGVEDIAEIGLIDLENGNIFIPLAETSAWNWQQGAMVQWVTAPGGRSVIFNKREGNRIVSTIVNIETQTWNTLPLPIYAVSPEGGLALGIDFIWLAQMRSGYGYIAQQPAQFDWYEGGIHSVNLETNQPELILSYHDIVNFEPHPLMKDAVHWVEHLLVNPTGTRFLFLHRFQVPSGAMYTRLLTANVDGSDLFLLLQGSVSHYCWYSPQEILVWARRRPFNQQIRVRNLINRLPLKRILLSWMGKQRGWVRQNVIGDSLHLLMDQSSHYQIIGQNTITEDGHPSMSPDGRWIVMDTYPDESRYQHLFLYDCLCGKRVHLGSFYSPPDFTGAFRCDLHPRWSRDGHYICIDSTHTGHRQLYILDVKAVVSS